MLNQKSFLAVDFGAGSLKLAEFEVNEAGGLRLKQYAIRPLGPEGAQETAREGLRINTNKYRLTAALLSDVLQSEANLAESNHQYQQTLLNYWTARADFEKALGEDK